MKLEELLKMPSSGIKTEPKKGTGRGRNNQSTGYRGISMRTDRDRYRRSPYQVFTRTTPAIYIGCAKTMEQALDMQRNYVPEIAPRDCSNIPGVIWAATSYRARVTVNGLLFMRRGFTTPEEAAEWIEDRRREHQQPE
ncbi:hypothetical protein [Pantoea phage Nafs113]|nr:hypothetical protein [Pantoea phage Nafs113]